MRCLGCRSGSRRPCLKHAQQLASVWQSADMQLMVLDYDLRVVLWSQGMAKALSGFEVKKGTKFTGLPFASADERHRAIKALDSVMSEPTLLHPIFALQVTIEFVPIFLVSLLRAHIGLRSV